MTGGALLDNLSAITYNADIDAAGKYALFSLWVENVESIMQFVI